ncbi:hypothetical protein [Microbacterium sp. SL75]|uniref:hypothetical protein n=1 Tax=Microbacterium sp. SL75 TaxID=2995140 RepID=UPI00226FEC31|nr:hypothetical protein [Microbacterium sp. SL75]WAC70167.1 hypothetical protein OVA17_05595 [Microbacterium sp. SL75]
MAALSRLPISGSETWLAPANVYFHSAGERVLADGKTVPPSQYSDFADYLAAASFIHSADSWAYLGRALHAVLQGDVHGAVHLCYYAELRAAISLLSTEGIYVGNRCSLALSGAGVAEVTGVGTHVATWMVLNSWARSTRAQDLFGKILRPIGAPLYEWANNMGSGITPIVEGLLDDIAFDLSAFSEDRNRRNHASYQPTRVEPDDLSAQDCAQIVDDVWTLLEPESRGTFPVLDRLLLRHLAVGVYAPTHEELDPYGVPTGRTDWSGWSSWLTSVAPGGVERDPYFVSIRTDPEDLSRDGALEAAFTRSHGAPSAYLSEMLLRTTILARLATGACVELLDDSGLGADDVSTWVVGLGGARALWSDDAPDPMIDLWADAEIAKEELELSSKASHHALITGMREYLAVLGQAERVAAWSFAS